MIAKAFLTLLICVFTAFPSLAANVIDNEFFSLDLPAGWEATPPAAMGNEGQSFSIVKSTGDCLANISVMPYEGTAGELIRQIGKTMSENGIIMGELRQSDNIFYCRFKKKESSGILYVGANGREAAMTTIYGSSKMQRMANSMLRSLRPKTDSSIFPKFD